MHQLILHIVSIVFPDLRTAYVLPPILQVPQRIRNATCLLPYREPAVSACIKAVKYQRNQQAARTLAAVLDSELATYPQPVRVVTIPQHYTRWRERGFDHLAYILNQCETKPTIRTDILQKLTHTRRQAHVGREERLTQQAGTFTCHPAASSLTGTVVLFDDVLTTGATMDAAKAALAPQLSSDVTLRCLALAH